MASRAVRARMSPEAVERMQRYNAARLRERRGSTAPYRPHAQPQASASIDLRHLRLFESLALGTIPPPGWPRPACREPNFQSHLVAIPDGDG